MAAKFGYVTHALPMASSLVPELTSCWRHDFFLLLLCVLQSTWELTSKLLADGLDISPVITHRFDDIADFKLGIDAMHKGYACLCCRLLLQVIRARLTAVCCGMRVFVWLCLPCSECGKAIFYCNGREAAGVPADA